MQTIGEMLHTGIQCRVDIHHANIEVILYWKTAKYLYVYVFYKYG